MNKLFGKLLRLSVFILIVSTVVSCGLSSRLNNSIYFNERKDSLLALVAKNYEPTVQPGDRLNITVSALDPISVAPFNKAAVSNNLGFLEGFQVENDGTIKFPQLGKIHVAGLVRAAVADTLTKRISAFVNEPMVSVQFINFRVTVMGEVNRPSVINISEGKANVLEAIGLAGDITPFGRKDDIMIIREKNGKREFGQINLLSMNTFNSPYYYLQQNDILYIRPIKSRANTNDQTNLLRNLSVITSILSVVSTIFILVINITK